MTRSHDSIHSDGTRLQSVEEIGKECPDDGFQEAEVIVEAERCRPSDVFRACECRRIPKWDGEITGTVHRILAHSMHL
jgi:hypothetical protein